MAQWPLTLPAPSLNSLSEKPPDNAIRSSMEKGPAKVRRRTTANVRPIGFTLNLTPTQLETLDQFYNEETYSGIDAFDYVHPRTGAACQARFTQPPQYAEREGVLYSVSVALEVLP